MDKKTYQKFYMRQKRALVPLKTEKVNIKNMEIEEKRKYYREKNNKYRERKLLKKIEEKRKNESCNITM